MILFLFFIMMLNDIIRNVILIQDRISSISNTTSSTSNTTSSITNRVQWNNAYINAAMIGNLDEVIYLLNDAQFHQIADIHANNDDAALLACEEGHLDIVRYLLTSKDLKQHICVNTRDDRLIKCACINNNIEMIKLLFEVGTPDVSSQKFFAFTWLFKLGHLDTIIFLLDRKNIKALYIDIHMHNDLCFKHAINRHHRHILSYLIQDLRIEKTMHIAKAIDAIEDDGLQQYIHTLFQRRTFYEKLSDELLCHKEVKDIQKI